MTQIADNVFLIYNHPVLRNNRPVDLPNTTIVHQLSMMGERGNKNQWRTYFHSGPYCLPNKKKLIIVEGTFCITFLGGNI